MSIIALWKSTPFDIYELKRISMDDYVSKFDTEKLEKCILRLNYQIEFLERTLYERRVCRTIIQDNLDIRESISEELVDNIGK